MIVKKLFYVYSFWFEAILCSNWFSDWLDGFVEMFRISIFFSVLFREYVWINCFSKIKLIRQWFSCVEFFPFSAILPTECTLNDDEFRFLCNFKFESEYKTDIFDRAFKLGILFSFCFNIWFLCECSQVSSFSPSMCVCDCFFFPIVVKCRTF